LEGLTEEISDVTKIESRTFMLNMEEFILNDLIINAIDDIIINKDNKVLDAAAYANKETPTTTKIQYNPKEPIFLNADKNRISQVISNLLANAVRFTKDDNSTILIDAKEDENYVIATIKDSGEEIGDKILPRLFSKFTTGSYQGSGLGLFISKKIIETHGGRIWAQNNLDGQGATFGFSLPRNQIRKRM
jgi:signal transduction histidine kinase